MSTRRWAVGAYPRLDMRVFLVLGVLAVVSVGVVVGCGNRQRQARTSIPVETLETPKSTTIYVMRSSAMEPTIHCAEPGQGCEAASDDQVVVERPIAHPQRGNVVAFETPALATRECGAGGLFVSRIIGIPGDVWKERNGVVYVSGRRLDEPYVDADRRDSETNTMADIPPHSLTTIPPGMYLMMGDNRASSCDSRRWGLVPQAKLVGRVVRIRRAGRG